jgi:uncharacterized protein (TIGR03067 family)
MGGSLLLVAVAVGAPALKDRPKPGDIAGEWLVVEYSGGGRATPFDEGFGYTFRADGTCEFRPSAAHAPEPGRYTTDPAGRPPAIDLIVADPKCPVVRGIYRVQGDTLTLCFGGSDRPTAFESPEGQATWLYVLRRAKKKP